MSLPVASTALVDGLEVWLKPASSNSGASTLNLNLFDVKSIRNSDGSVLQGGELTAGYYSQLKYKGTYWQITSNTAREMMSTGLNENSVGNIASLQSLADSRTTIYVEGRLAPNDGGQGVFVFSLGNFTDQVINDPLHGVYVPTNGDPTGALGVWTRQFRDLSSAFFGTLADWNGITGTGQ